MGRKWEAAISALLCSGTLSEAAATAGISEKTLRSWMKDSAFSAAYRAARGEILERTVGRLLRASVRAVATLEAALDADRVGDRIRAAAAILDRAASGLELLDLVARVEELERKAGTGQ
jgi:hypothetical protein